jgi:predicted acyl esterase
MRAWAIVMLAVLLGGCLGAKAPPARAVVPADVGHDPAAILVTGFSAENVTFPSWDGITHLSAVAYLPQSGDRLPGGSAPRWPLVVFVHGWGQEKESYEGEQVAVPGQPLPVTPGPNRLKEFALGGIVAVAYDARGFGKSEGASTVAGPAEMADLDAVIDYALAHYPTNGRVGVVGGSYGGGHAYEAWARNPKVATAVAMYGWVDLYGALLPGNVPKLEWAQALYGYGLAGSKARYDPMIQSWYQQIYTRSDLATVHRQMDERSALDAMPSVHKPLFVCQGMQESLFPQIDQAWQGAGGFTRAYVFTGGHGAGNGPCWQRSLEWFQFFLGGYDTRVDSWPALETVDASGIGDPTAYATFPDAAPRTFHLRLGDLYEGAPSGATFTVQQRLAANPLQEPAVLWDDMGAPNQALPDPLRQDPAAVVFTTGALQGSQVLVGAPTLRLHLHEGAAPFQVAATLYLVHADGNSVVLSRGAAAALDNTDIHAGNVDIRLTWTRAAVSPNDRLELKLAANDPSWWMPLAADYSVTFDGLSSLGVPMEG